jgi:hypothetical protein
MGRWVGEENGGWRRGKDGGEGIIRGGNGGYLTSSKTESSKQIQIKG